MSAKVAGNLTPYQSPALASIHTSMRRESLLERVGVTEREVYAEVMAEIVESEELPRSVKAYLTNFGLNGANGGGKSGGGVANRDPD
jgi:hypothetical protein